MRDIKIVLTMNCEPTTETSHPLATGRANRSDNENAVLGYVEVAPFAAAADARGVVARYRCARCRSPKRISRSSSVMRRCRCSFSTLTPRRTPGRAAIVCDQRATLG